MTSLASAAAFLISNGATLLWWRTARGVLQGGVFALVLTAFLCYLGVTPSATPFDVWGSLGCALIVALWHGTSMVLKAASMGGLPSTSHGQPGGPLSHLSSLASATLLQHVSLQLALAGLALYLLWCMGVWGVEAAPPGCSWSPSGLGLVLATAVAVVVGVWRWQGGGGVTQALLAGAPVEWLQCSYEGGQSGSKKGEEEKEGGGGGFRLATSDVPPPSRLWVTVRVGLRECVAVLVRTLVLSTLLLPVLARVLGGGSATGCCFPPLPAPRGSTKYGLLWGGGGGENPLPPSSSSHQGTCGPTPSLAPLASSVLYGTFLVVMGHATATAILPVLFTERLRSLVLLEGVEGSPLAPSTPLRHVSESRPLADLTVRSGAVERLVASPDQPLNYTLPPNPPPTSNTLTHYPCVLGRPDLTAVALRCTIPGSVHHYLLSWPAEALSEEGAPSPESVGMVWLSGRGGGPSSSSSFSSTLPGGTAMDGGSLYHRRFLGASLPPPGGVGGGITTSTTLLGRGGGGGGGVSTYALSFIPPPWRPVVLLPLAPVSLEGTPSYLPLFPATLPLPDLPFTVTHLSVKEAGILSAWQRRVCSGEWTLWCGESNVEGGVGGYTLSKASQCAQALGWEGVGESVGGWAGHSGGLGVQPSLQHLLHTQPQPVSEVEVSRWWWGGWWGVKAWLGVGKVGVGIGGSASCRTPTLLQPILFLSSCMGGGDGGKEGGFNGSRLRNLLTLPWVSSPDLGMSTPAFTAANGAVAKAAVAASASAPVVSIGGVPQQGNPPPDASFAASGSTGRSSSRSMRMPGTTTISSSSSLSSSTLPSYGGAATRRGVDAFTPPPPSTPSAALFSLLFKRATLPMGFHTSPLKHPYMASLPSLSPWLYILRDLVLCSSQPALISQGATQWGLVNGGGGGVHSLSTPMEGVRAPRLGGFDWEGSPFTSLGANGLTHSERGGTLLFSEVKGKKWREFVWAATALIDATTVALFAAAAATTATTASSTTTNSIAATSTAASFSRPLPCSGYPTRTPSASVKEAAEVEANAMAATLASGSVHPTTAAAAAASLPTRDDTQSPWLTRILYYAVRYLLVTNALAAFVRARAWHGGLWVVSHVRWVVSWVYSLTLHPVGVFYGALQRVGGPIDPVREGLAWCEGGGSKGGRRDFLSKPPILPLLLVEAVGGVAMAPPLSLAVANTLTMLLAPSAAPLLSASRGASEGEGGGRGGRGSGLRHRRGPGGNEGAPSSTTGASVAPQGGEGTSTEDGEPPHPPSTLYTRCAGCATRGLAETLWRVKQAVLSAALLTLSLASDIVWASGAPTLIGLALGVVLQVVFNVSLLFRSLSMGGSGGSSGGGGEEVGGVECGGGGDYFTPSGTPNPLAFKAAVLSLGPSPLERVLCRSPAQTTADLLKDVRAVVAAADLLASLTRDGLRGEDRVGVVKESVSAIVYSLALGAVACATYASSPRYVASVGLGGERCLWWEGREEAECVEGVYAALKAVQSGGGGEVVMEGGGGGGGGCVIPLTYVNITLPCVSGAILRGGITRTHTQTNPPGGQHSSTTSSLASSTFGLGGTLRMSQLGGTTTNGGGLGGASTLKGGDGKLSPADPFTLGAVPAHYRPSLAILQASLMTCLRSILTVLPETVQKDLAFKAPSAALKAAVLAAISN